MTQCYSKLPPDQWDDAFAEQDAPLVASRQDDPAIDNQIQAIIDAALAPSAAVAPVPKTATTRNKSQA